MGLGISVWRMTPKKSKLKIYEKECCLCFSAALNGEDFCEKCIEKGLKK